MKKSILHLAYLLLITCPLTAYSLTVPKSSGVDARIRFVIYNPQQVVQLNSVAGVATHIVVQEGEEYITHAFGASQAWSFFHEGNHYFIKPQDQDADTNLTLVTNLRTYYFRLNYSPNHNTEAMYGVNFRYLDTQNKQNFERSKKMAIERGFMGQRGDYNLSYSMSGDKDIAPVNAWDNHEFTYFKFSGNQDVPGVYLVDSDGQESIVNRNVTGIANNIIVVHKVNAKWVLRLGKRALAIYNEDFDPKGVVNASGTASPNVKRVIKGG